MKSGKAPERKGRGGGKRRREEEKREEGEERWGKM